MSHVDFLISSSVVFMTSTVPLFSGATRNSYFMTLLGLKVEMSISLKMFRTSSESMQRQQKLKISFTPSGQFPNFPNVTLLSILTLSYRFCFTPDSSRPLLELEQRFFNEKRAGNGFLLFFSVLLSILTFLSSSHCNLH